MSSRTRRRLAAHAKLKSVRATGSTAALRRAVSGSRNSAMAYMNVEEIESALQSLATSHPNVTELILLPNRTSEGRQSHALRIGPPDAQGTSTFAVTGGLHAREW